MRTLVGVVIGTATLASGSGCSDRYAVPPFDVVGTNKATTSPEPDRPAPKAPPAADDEAYRVADHRQGGVITGRVRFEGDRPKPLVLRVQQHPERCGSRQPAPLLELGPGGAVTQAVVWLDLKQGRKPVVSPEPMVVELQRCRFVPHVITAVQDQVFEFRNGDPFLHNVHGVWTKETWDEGALWFDQGLPQEGARSLQRAVQSGVARVEDDAGYPWATSWIHVFPHPYHAVTNDQGAFRFEDVPPGEHTVRVWHEGFELKGYRSGRPIPQAPIMLNRRVRVGGGETADVSFTFPG